MAVKKKYNALGRGLDALISSDEVQHNVGTTINEIPIEQIEPNPNQPRRDFDPATLQDLASSIRELGIIQPITLRQTSEGKYQIVAGERRWRASQLVGLKTIPAYIRTIDDDSATQMALVENIQRDDLNAIEIALAYAHLLEQEGMTQEKVSERVGKSRVAVANYLRLLKLPAQVQMALQKHEIDMGHARALLSLDSPSQQIKVFREIQKNGSSVRQVEEIVKKLKSGEDVSLGGKKLSTKNPMSEEIKMLREQLSDFLHTKVSLSISPSGKGKISIPFTNEEELEHIMSVFDHLKGK
ncbi:MAG: ParB/RepB/Spo0J family partition protein [Prevotella sp.]|nr:ParB/RepB/Spo0J family partition protein [Prevotella sp.]